LYQQCITCPLSSAQKVSTSPDNLLARKKTDPVDANSQQNPGGAHTRGTGPSRTTSIQMEIPVLITSDTNQEKSTRVAKSTAASNFPVESPVLHPVAPISAILVMAVMLGYLLLAQLCNPGFTALPLFNLSAGYMYWNYHQPSSQAQSAKSRTSYFCWITAISSNAKIWHGISLHIAISNLWSLRAWPVHQSIVVHIPLPLQCTMSNFVNGPCIHCHLAVLPV